MLIEPSRSWRSIDLGPILSGQWSPPQPAVGARRDGIGLFYPRKMHSVASESEAGKTWLAISTAYHELRQGNSVLYIDFEDDENGIVGRLLTFHTPHEWIRERFHYKRPTQSVNTEINLADLYETVEQHNPTLAVIDDQTGRTTMRPRGNFLRRRRPPLPPRRHQ
ncbi:AAA family ATPase [Mycobacterium sp. 1465703.0]|uniref:AAA family ATPase n=1 Tax=Mycobacterium sp. 1465703.0 TaxID=1834078 RepID=UPI0007FF5789|nr:AAA family ATPase [Mycobacterium sp. 1465703.0]OBJ09669.1 hypothetical protein A5625_12650 [Mycobacterium sp. 1465703.0]